MSDKSEHPPVPEEFAKLGVRQSILRALAVEKFITPSEIQSLLIPRALAGVDILGQARTGTGKTAAFAIPLLSMCNKGVATQAIVLVPTRELCVQVETEFLRIGQFTPIRTYAVFGGSKIAAQIKHLKTHPEILVGTPGRVLDLLERRVIQFSNIRFIVLDEVDRMLDIGFRDDIRRILSRVDSLVIKGGDEGSEERHEGGKSGSPDGDSESASAGTPKRRHPQTIFVSATISEEIERLARRYMRDPEKLIAPGADEKPTVEKVEQCYFSVQPWDKYRLLKALLEREQPELAIVFCRTKRGAEKLAKKLHADGIECREIHGNLRQSKRDRVMQGFRKGKFDVLIATDLASRGIDVADISHIINYDIPDDPEVYVHRVGRTARMGAQGKAYTFVAKDQGDELTRVEALINMEIAKGDIEGFTPSPEPRDWTVEKPGARPPESATQAASEAQPQMITIPGIDKPIPMPPKTMGSKIRRNRR
jgi:ATP-dependent RNA helicase DeaD